METGKTKTNWITILHRIITIILTILTGIGAENVI